MSPPKLCWENKLSEELAESGATLRFIGLGTSDKNDDEIIGWYVILARPDGEHKLLVKQLKYEPRVIKTFAGARALVRQYLPEWKSVTVPIIPSVRAEPEIWALLDKLNAEKNQN